MIIICLIILDLSLQHGMTPLHQGAQQGHVAIINILLQHKADPDETANVSFPLFSSFKFPKWDLSEVIRDKHSINKNIPGLGPQKMYMYSHVRSAAEMACLSQMTCSWRMRKWNTELAYSDRGCNTDCHNISTHIIVP